MTLRRVLAGVFLWVAATTAFAQNFYTDRLQRGIAHYQKGNYVAAAQELRLAAFGLLDSPPEYETALIYEVLANDNAHRAEDATLAAVRILHVEKVAPAYAQLRLPGGLRQTFESVVPKVLTSEQLARTPALAHLAGRSAAPVPPPAPPPPRASAGPTPAGMLAAEAYAKLRSGDETGSRQLAEQVTADDYTNALAHTVLAILAGRSNDWKGVADHYSIVRTRRRLDDEESVAYYTALVRSGRTADAAGVEKIMPATARRRIAAAAAPTPVPAPMPGPHLQPFVASATPPPAETPQTLLAAADRLLAAGNVVAARDAYTHLAQNRDLTRQQALSVARGLNQSAAYRISSSVYQKLYPLHGGEEVHMFYEAVNRYEMGDYSIARLLMTRALPALPRTPQVELYRKRIESGH